jgi:UDPglucose 6-dehydrogenase
MSSAAEPIAIVGVGRLGLCAALCFARAGYDVLGCDVNATYVDALNARSFASSEPGVSDALKASSVRFCTSLNESLAHSSMVWIFVDTPAGAAGGQSYDHSKLSRVLQLIAASDVVRNRSAVTHLMVGCTVMPGYLGGVARYLLRDALAANAVSLNYNPEFIAQGDIMRGFVHPDMVLIGEASPAAGDAIAAVYARVCTSSPRVCRMSPESAELTKLSLNCFITMKIAYANAIADIAASTPGADADAILAAVGADSRVGQKCLKPGYGFGGPCFPRDNEALGHYAASIGREPLLPRATDAANAAHRAFQVEQLLRAHPDPAHRFHFDSVTYKDNCPVPIIEHSQKLLVAAALARAGRLVTVRDRIDVIECVQREYGGLFTYETNEEEDERQS